MSNAAGVFYSNRVLAISDNIDEMGYPQWEHVLCLLLSWSIVFLCLIKGIKSSGKVATTCASGLSCHRVGTVNIYGVMLLVNLL